MKDVDVRVRDIYEQCQIEPSYVLDKLTELEDRSRRNNLHLDGINGEKDETWGMCETKIKNIFQDKLEIHEDIIIERADRTKGETTRNNTTGKKTTQDNLNKTCQLQRQKHDLVKRS